MLPILKSIRLPIELIRPYKVRMKICILDPFHNMPGLTKVFPEAGYYSYPPDGIYNYHWTNHMTPRDFKGYYGFEYNTDFSSITSETCDILAIVLVVYDTKVHKAAGGMLGIIQELLRTQPFKKVVLFDTHDYDYDPTLFIPSGIDTFFKRNYCTNKQYDKRVVPFPVSMFVRKCILWSMVEYTDVPRNLSPPAINDALWCGSTYKHIDHEYNIVRDRASAYMQIQPYVQTRHFPDSDTMIRAFRSFKICVDLSGVGSPNKRTIEIFISGSLRMYNFNDLNWGFDEGDSFHEACYFSSADDFIAKKNRLLSDEQVYNSALLCQETLIRKYFNKDSLKAYILRSIQ